MFMLDIMVAAVNGMLTFLPAGVVVPQPMVLMPPLVLLEMVVTAFK
jgi:hypothetical protein